MTRAFSEAASKEFEAIVASYPTRKAALLPVLRLAEREFGGLDPAAMKFVAGLLGLSPAHVLGVVSFYTHYRLAGMGRCRISVCSTLSCALAGSEAVFDRLAELLEGRPASGEFTLEKAECLGACDRAPVVSVNDDYRERLTPEAAVALLEELGRS